MKKEDRTIVIFKLRVFSYWFSENEGREGGQRPFRTFPKIHPFWYIVEADTQIDSIQCLNFANKWFIQYSIEYCFTQYSIQNIIQFKKNLLVNSKDNSTQ